MVFYSRLLSDGEETGINPLHPVLSATRAFPGLGTGDSGETGPVWGFSVLLFFRFSERRAGEGGWASVLLQLQQQKKTAQPFPLSRGQNNSGRDLYALS